MFFLLGRYCRWEISSGINTNETLSRFLGEKGWSSVSWHPWAESVSGSGGERHCCYFGLQELICCFAEQCHFNPAGENFFFFPPLKLKKKKKKKDSLYTIMQLWGGKSFFKASSMSEERKLRKRDLLSSKKKNLTRHNFSQHQWRQSIVIHFAIHSYLCFFFLLGFFQILLFKTPVKCFLLKMSTRLIDYHVRKVRCPLKTTNRTENTTKLKGIIFPTQDKCRTKDSSRFGLLHLLAPSPILNDVFSTQWIKSPMRWSFPKVTKIYCEWGDTTPRAANSHSSGCEMDERSGPNILMKLSWALTRASSSMYTAGRLAVTKYCTFLRLQPRTYMRRPHTAAVDLPTPALQWT